MKTTAKLFAAMSRAYPRSYAWIGLGRALAASGRPSEAADACRKALATDATDFEARMRLGELAKKAPTR
jgi:Flp pilus assembly protein TadD